MPLDGFAAWQIATAAVIVFCAFVIRGMSGFGAGMVAVPLLVMVLPLEVAVPTMTLLGFLVLVFVSVRDRRHVLASEFRLLLLPTLVGVATGVLLLSAVGGAVMVKVLGVLVIAYAAYLLLAPQVAASSEPCARAWGPPAAFGSAVVDTAFGSGGGALVVIYMTQRRIARAEFRATIAAVWVAEALSRIAGYGSAGFYKQEVLLLALLLLPMMWVGTMLGERIGNVISQRAFSRVIALLLTGSGIVLLSK